MTRHPKRALRSVLPIVLLCGSWLQTPVLAAPAVDDEFDAICQRLRTGNNSYFSDRLAVDLRARLAAGGEESVERVGTRGLLGRELLRLARTEEAIGLLEEAFSTARELEVPDGLLSSIHWQLALAHLQRAEELNCVDHRTAASCILPISSEGIHPLPEHSRRAGDLFLQYAAGHPRNVQAVWLLNLARSVSGDYPSGVPEALRLPSGALESPASFAHWRDVAPALGVDALDLAGGAVLDDFDGDGFLDLVTSTWDPCDHLKAFRSDGEGGFEEVTEAWGLTEQLGGLNMVHADYDNDGDLDLLILRGAWLLDEGHIRNSLLRNDLDKEPDGHGGFVDVTRVAGLAEPAYPTQTAGWADYDGDGDLDLFVGNEAHKGSDYPSQLYRNRGNGTFEEVASAAGVTNRRYAKAVAWGDYDNDGDPDLFVSNFGENRLYRNDGKRGFTDVAPELGVTEPVMESFASWFFDYDNDGDLDLFVADYRQQAAQVTASYFGASFEQGQALLYRNDLDGGSGAGFTEVSRQLGITRPTMPMGANYGDLDNDGWLDIYLGTGEPDLASLMPNVMYRNDRGEFVEITFVGGFGHLQKGHGVAFGDVDNDGDQDLLHQLGGFYPTDDFGNALFVNPGPVGHWVTLRLEGRRANRFGVGARIEARIMEADGDRVATRAIHVLAGSGGSFGASSMQQEIGLGRARQIDELIVRWPGSVEQRFRDVAVDKFYRLVEGAEELVPVEVQTLDLGR